MLRDEINMDDLKRYEFIDLLKVIAIFCVIIYHYNNMTIDLFMSGNTNSCLNYFFLTSFSVGVPIFFFVNGALLLNKEFKLKKHILKLKKIVVLTLVWAVITLLILMPLKNEYMTLFEFAKSLATWKGGWIDHLWFLKALVVTYIFFPLIKKVYDEDQNILCFFLVVTFLLTFGNVILSNCANIVEFIAGVNYLKGNANFFGEFNPFRGIYGFSMIYFILGGLFFKYRKELFHKNWTKKAIGIIIVSMILLTGYGVMMTKSNEEVFDIVWYGYDSIPTLFMVIAFYILALRYKGKHGISSVIKLVAQNSFGIYLVHRIWGSFFIKYFQKLSYSTSILVNILFALFLILVCLVTVLILKTVPLIRELFNI